MGHKKRNPTPRTKPLPPPSTAAQPPPDDPEAASPPEPPPTETNGTSYASIKVECERALNALRRGNHTKALRLMKEAISHAPPHASPHATALIYRVQGTVCVKVASIIDDQNAKQRHLKNAIDSARKAVELAPDSVEFGHFYANLLYEAANEGREYEEVMRECDRALEILNPIDPGKESLQEESQLKISSAEARVLHVQNELRSLKQKANIASISTWMKNLGTGEEIRLIPIRRAVEDPMEVRLVQSRRPNEIKKATKTQEERRKEIEVRVAAARLLQQKSETGFVERSERSEMGSGGNERRGERRKYGRRNGSNKERKDWVQSYWNSMTAEMKKGLLGVNVADLKSYFSKDGLTSEVLEECLGFGEEYKSWRFWMCCKCVEKFSDSESHIHHVVQEHMGNLMPKMQAVLPQSIDNEWSEMILNCVWKPMNISAMVKMLGNQEKSQDMDIVEDFCSGNHNDECDDCFKDAWDSSPEKENLRDGYSDCNSGSTNNDKDSSFECKECDGNNRGLTAVSMESWPLSDDPERAKLLEKIRGVFEGLIRHKYLAASHLSKVIQFTMDELQTMVSGSQLLQHGVEQSPVCICFLGASQLKKVLKFLQELSHSCGLSRYSDKGTIVDDANSGSLSSDVRENIVLNGDAACLYLDERLLSSEWASTMKCNDNAGTATSASVVNGDLVPSDADSLLAWIFAGPSSGEQLQTWIHTKDEKVQQGVEILQTLEKEFYHLQSLCERKCEHLSYEEALQAVEDLCLEEGKKRDADPDSLNSSYHSVLTNRRDELAFAPNRSDAPFISSRIELDAISSVLKEAEALNVNQFGYEDTYGGMTSQLCDLESGEDDGWRARDNWHHMDTCIEVAIQRQKEQLSVELSKIDARIMRSVTVMQQLELRLEPVSAHDYRLILLPLVKSYLRAHLEELAEKDATEKSDAAREAFLAELALDSKKATRGGSDNAKTSLEKAKEKKKNREYRKAKDSKGSSNEQRFLHDEASEQGSYPVASDGDHQDSDFPIYEDGNDLRKQEEEVRRKIELEAEERKLEETLEYQRRIENEAKLKHLAEQQHKKSNHLFSHKATEDLHDAYSEQDADEVHDLLLQEQLAPKNGLLNSLDGKLMTEDAVDSSLVSDTNAISVMHNRKLDQGLPNGGTVENGILPVERRRKSRRQKSSNKSFDGKYQNKTLEKDNCEVGNGDKEAKTLRQLKAEDDDDERFQSDLKKAVRQSLDTYQAHQRNPANSGLRIPQKMPMEVSNSGVSPSEVANENVDGADIFGTGLQNDIGEYNCFLNVIIQSLWHLRRFRDEFLKTSKLDHHHMGDPCVICALYDIFNALSAASMDVRREAVAPTTLRMALSNMFPDSNFFQQGQMNDASEVLGVIFNSLHTAFTTSTASDSDSVESNSKGYWDCKKDGCIVHSFFGMDIFERMNCFSCHLESRHLKYTTFFHNINASALRTMKVMCPESSFDELLNLVEMNHQLACDPEAGGCGKANYIHHILSSPPRVFTTVLGWQNTCESADDIAATLSALSTEIDISVLYRGLDPKNIHRLVSVVCYYGQHYHCFAYSHDHDRWIMYDDKTVKVIGGWSEVLSMCERGHLQPQVLFFEAVR